MLTTRQVAEQLRISQQGVQYYVTSGRLPAHYVGWRRYFLAADVERLQQERKPPGRPKRANGHG
jgi:excisionase family DNA binding protein